MTLIHKLCAMLRHPFRRLIRMDIDLQHAHRTRYYLCRVCGEVMREDEYEKDSCF